MSVKAMADAMGRYFFPKINHAYILRGGGPSGVDGTHVIFSELQPSRSLSRGRCRDPSHRGAQRRCERCTRFRLTLYNLVDVVTDMKSIARLEHATALIALHRSIFEQKFSSLQLARRCKDCMLLILNSGGVGQVARARVS